MTKMARAAMLSVSVASLALALAPAAGAADLDPVYIEDAGKTPVEYGSGWYLRGDIGGSFLNGGNLSYYSDARYNYDNQSFDHALTYGGGFGYIYNSHLRADLTWDYSGNVGWSGRTFGTNCGVGATGECYSEESAQYDRNSIHANLYYTLGNWSGFSPYVGAGLGASHIQWNNYSSIGVCELDPGETCALGVHSGGPDTEIFRSAATSYPTESAVAFSWSLMAGLDYRINENWTIDLGYKYTRVGGGTVIARDAAGPGSPQGDSLFDHLDIHEVKVGLRYEIW